jgi:hypothetical protein
MGLYATKIEFSVRGGDTLSEDRLLRFAIDACRMLYTVRKP